MSTVIKVNNISKQYRLGQIGTGTLSHDINRWWHKVRGLEDPYLKLGEENDRSKKGNSEYAWALQDVNFEVKQGEVLGIIGKNGAGKSTLLKILSRTTAPTSGSIKIKGRVASLLEVGTGFHPELTGTENIYLNGAILGMKRQEIRSKFEQIVDFSGVEKYIDTPVKRYSSGMYVRLAFAVAAHLDPEILIVDEVLAVGDAEFQRKCLGKMKDVSGKEGKTILFVSHNISAIKQLCTHGLLLKNGVVTEDGSVYEVTEKYINSAVADKRIAIDGGGQLLGNEKINIISATAYAKGKDIRLPIKSNDDIIIELEFENKMRDVDLDITWDIFDNDSTHLCHIGTLINKGEKSEPGKFRVSFTIPKNLLNAKRYHFNVMFGIDQKHVAFDVENILIVDVEDELVRQGASYHDCPGIIHPRFDWVIEQV